MNFKIYIILLVFLATLLTGCGGGSSTSEPVKPEQATGPKVIFDVDEKRSSENGSLFIRGTVKYERVVAKHINGSSQLDYDNIIIELAKYVTVKAINANDEIIAETITDEHGDYRITNLPNDTEIKIRVYAKMFKSDKWDVKVIDNTNGDGQYVMEGSLISTGSENTIRDLMAPIDGRTSSSFAILGSAYEAMAKVLSVDSSVVFPPLKFKWSVDNIETGTYYDGLESIVLLGDANGDSDEFDSHIVIHEWGHYFENKFSRADNIGGGHGSNEYLDIRVAFGEGFGNALSAIVTDDPIYSDTVKNGGWNMNIEEAEHETSGWFSEASVQRILYDLYDSNDDSNGNDLLSLGFAPIYDVLVGAQKDTKAFTSIFSFITALKTENISKVDDIDAIVSSENIGQIDDIYALNRDNSVVEEHTLPLYHEIDVGNVLSSICTSNNYGYYNKLNNHKFVRFHINSEDSYTIRVEQNNGSDSDPNFKLFKTEPFEMQLDANRLGVENRTIMLTAGDYLLDISDAQNVSNVCFDLSIN